ncbi:MAG: hypothetical protein ACPGUV_00465, partial [Polyangiales bacterium]
MRQSAAAGVFGALRKEPRVLYLLDFLDWHASCLQTSAGGDMGTMMQASLMDRYRSSLTGKVTPLSPEEERALALAWRQGDDRAGRRLVEASLPFVIRVAREYRCWGVDLEDLV